MTPRNNRPMLPKFKYSHIFFTNMNDNFGLDFVWPKDSHSVPNTPKKFIPTKPFHMLQDLKTIFKDKPVFVIGSGPSLNINIHELKLLETHTPRDQYVILSCDGSIWDLKEWGIKPDFVISAEADGQHNRPQIPTTDLLLNGGDLEWFSDVPLIGPTWCNKSFVEKWPCKKVFYYVNHDLRYQYFWDVHPEMFPSDTDWALIDARCSVVGFHAIDVCRYLEASEAILLGFDMAVVDSKKHHSEKFNLDWEADKTDLKQCYADHVLWFLNNFNGEFNMNVSNCTEGGALTEGLCDAKWMTLSQKLLEIRTVQHATVTSR